MSDKDTLGIPFWWQRCGCTEPPPYSAGEQIAMQAEIDDLRKELKLVYEKLEYAEDMIPCFDELLEDKFGDLND